MIKQFKNRHDFFRAGLKNLRDKHSMKQIELAEKAGVDRGVVSHIETGRRTASDSAQWLLAGVFGLTPEQLIEHGQYILENILPEEVPEPAPRPFQIFVNDPEDRKIIESTVENYRGIPLYVSGRLSAGSNGLYFDDNEYPESEVIVFRPELGHRSKHNLVAVRVGGKSMNPTIPEQSIIVVDMDDREFVNRKIFCVNDPDDSGQWVSAVKRVQRWEKGFVLISDNSEVPPKVVGLDWPDLCVGRVIWMWRNTEDL